MFEFLFKYSRTTFEQGDFLFASGWPIWLLVAACVAGMLAIGFTLARQRESMSIVKLVALGAIQTAMLAVVLTLLAGYLYLLGPSIARYRDLARAGSEEALQTALDSARAGAVAISATESPST